MKILGAILELPAKQPIYLKIGPNWPNWQCCIAGSSKSAPRILISSIAMGADYTFYVKNIETHARTFFTLNISVIGRVWIQTTPKYYFHQTLQANLSERFVFLNNEWTLGVEFSRNKWCLPKWVEKIQATAYNGASTVIKWPICNFGWSLLGKKTFWGQG